MFLSEPAPPQPPLRCRHHPCAADAAAALPAVATLLLRPSHCRCVAVTPSIAIAVALPLRCPLPPLLVDCCLLPQRAVLPWQEGVAMVAEWQRYKKLSNSLVVTRWLPRMPVNPAHTIGGTQHVRWVLGEGGVGMGILGLLCSSRALPGSWLVWTSHHHGVGKMPVKVNFWR